MQDIIRFHVPCHIKYTKFVEDFSRVASGYLYPQSDEVFASKLCAVMNEVFVNIVEHTDTAKENEVVRFQFEIGLKYFSISIYDYGPGFKADGHLPPYPKELIGKRYMLRETLDGHVHYQIVDPFTITFLFEEKEIDLDDFDDLGMLEDNGLGISIITKLMDTVTYSYIGNGKFDWKLVKQI